MYLAVEIIIQNIFNVLQFYIALNLVLPFILFLLWKLHRKKELKKGVILEEEQDLAIIVTAYQETQQIPDVLASILKSNYQNYHIYVVADACDKENPALSIIHEKISILIPDEIIASNTGSHFYAIKNFIRKHDNLVIVDSDNLLDPNMLQELNRSFLQGYDAVQGLRAAKNLNTTYACLDAARDIYYHFYDGEILFELGSSSTLSGSGMAFKVALYEECLAHLNVKGAGFDKVLQYEILKKGKRIAFNKNAIIFDEKTSATDQLVNQRSRWINTWFKYFKFGFSLIFKGAIKFNVNQFLFGLVLLRPPLFIFLLLSLLFAFVNIFINPILFIVWIIFILIFVVGFLIPIYQTKTDDSIKKALISIPIFIYYQVISLFFSIKANKRSVATKHGYNKDKL